MFRKSVRFVEMLSNIFNHRFSGRALAGLVVLLFGFPLIAAADKPLFTETYDITPAPCEGLSLDGVSYSFTVAGSPSLDCTAGTFTGPGTTNDINPPNIEGTSSGILHLALDHPSTNFGFGVALNTVSSPQVAAVIVDLFRPGVGLLRQEVPLTATSDPAFVGGRFDYEGPAVATVTIHFSSGPFARFALDNVTYFVPPGQTK
jgi:hypothetical protein